MTLDETHIIPSAHSIQTDRAAWTQQTREGKVLLAGAQAAQQVSHITAINMVSASNLEGWRLS